MLVEGLFNVQGTKDKPNGREVISSSGVRYWTEWFKGVKTYLAKDDAKGLYFPPGNYVFDITEMMELKDGQIIMGAGWESRIFRGYPRGNREWVDENRPELGKIWVWDIPKDTWRPMFRISGAKNVCIRDVALDSGGGSSDGVHPIEVIGDSKNVRLDNIRCSNGHTAMWIKTGQDIRITNCESTGFLHNIYLGHHENTSSPHLQNVLISNCVLGDSKNLGSDGIKTLGRCNNLVIDGNVIKNCFKDAIDLFASGDRTVISNNDLQNSGANGIDIKTDYKTYPEDWGHQGQNLVIVGNQINGNGGYGIKIWAEYDLPEGSKLKHPFNVMIMGNQITENGYGGIANEGAYVSIMGNLISQNAAGFSKDAEGNFLPKPDEHGNKTYKKDKDGNYIYKYEDDGKALRVYETNVSGEYVYRDKDEKYIKTKKDANGNVIIDKNIEYEKDAGNKIIYKKVEVTTIDEYGRKKTITKMIPLPKKWHDREFELDPVKGSGIYLQPPADDKRASNKLRVIRWPFRTGTITNNIIVNNGHVDRFKTKIPGAGIICAGTQKNPIFPEDKVDYTLKNVLISNNILDNDLNQPNPYQERGILLVNARNILITDNHFGRGYSEKQALHNNKALVNSNGTFTSTNNIGLNNRTAPPQFTFAELEQRRKDRNVKQGELVYVKDLEEYFKKHLEEPFTEKELKDKKLKEKLEEKLKEKLEEYSSLAYYNGEHWMSLLKK